MRDNLLPLLQPCLTTFRLPVKTGLCQPATGCGRNPVLTSLVLGQTAARKKCPGTGLVLSGPELVLDLY